MGSLYRRVVPVHFTISITLAGLKNLLFSSLYTGRVFRYKVVRYIGVSVYTEPLGNLPARAYTPRGIGLKHFRKYL